MVLWFRDVIVEGTKIIAIIASLIFIVYTLLIECEITSAVLILQSFVAPIKPADDEPGDDKPQYLTKAKRSQFFLSDEQKEILTGLILGDLHILKQRTNPSLIFRQGIKHELYLLYLYDLFKDFCPSGPKIQNHAPDKRTGKVYSAIYFISYTLPCLIPLHEDFYVTGKKVVPLDIAERLTPLGLCYWICDDGFWDSNSRRVVLCTESFTPAEVQLLINVLNSKWNLDSYLSRRGESYRIMIPSRSVPHLRDLLKDIMPSMMLYKLGL